MSYFELVLFCVDQWYPLCRTLHDSAYWVTKQGSDPVCADGEGPQGLAVADVPDVSFLIIACALI